MNILLIEDEPFAAKSLIAEVKKIESSARIEGPVVSVKEAIARLKKQELPDLILCDIQLADGIAFDIFKEDIPPVPVIFTTAFNEFALKAFKLNSIDYLLKPIDGQELKLAFEKYKRLHAKYANRDFMEQFRLFFDGYPHVSPFKERIAAHEGKSVRILKTDELLYFQKMGEIISVVGHNGNEYFTDYRSLDETADLLNPKEYYRANRQFLVNLSAIQKFQTDEHGRVLLYFQVMNQPEIAVSKDRAAEFRKLLSSK